MPDPDVVTAAVGRNVRGQRGRLGWTLEELAGRSGVSKGMLIQVEQARTNPSVATLCRLATALGTSVAELVEAVEAPATRVVRADEGVVLWRGRHGGRGTLMVGTAPPDQVELWDARLEPGDAHVTEAHAAGTRELLLVVEGELTLEVGERGFTVGAGDAVTFPGDQPHAYRNHGDRPARVAMSVVHRSGGGRRPHPEPPAPGDGPQPARRSARRSA